MTSKATAGQVSRIFNCHKKHLPRPAATVCQHGERALHGGQKSQKIDR
ncbi:MAG: hypothetical protein JXD22_10540 [Sedimentisphaerales bacterium]|nr:hypothetical protein [Sedimentisphaerales bacterium]